VGTVDLGRKRLSLMLFGPGDALARPLPRRKTLEVIKQEVLRKVIGLNSLSLGMIKSTIVY